MSSTIWMPVSWASRPSSVTVHVAPASALTARVAHTPATHQRPLPSQPMARGVRGLSMATAFQPVPAASPLHTLRKKSTATKRPSGQAAMPIRELPPSISRFQLRPWSDDTSTAPLWVPATTTLPLPARDWVVS